MQHSDLAARDAAHGGLDTATRRLDILRRARMADALRPPTLQALAEAGRVRNVLKGRPLFSQGEPATVVAVLGEGTIALRRGQAGRPPMALGYRGAGDLVGEALLAGATTHREAAIATSDVEALLVPVAKLLAVSATDAALGAALLTTLGNRCEESEDRLASLISRPVEARLAELLVKALSRWGLAHPRGELLGLPVTHHDLADMIGSTRETVTLTLGNLRREGIIDFEKRRIVVLDREALRARG
jgi:CRP-like cAMP-binding protein